MTHESRGEQRFFCWLKIDMNNQYKTDDILISSYLLSKHARLLDITSDYQKHFIFIFEDSQKCTELANEYLNNGEAPARELFARREELISAMRHRN